MSAVIDNFETALADVSSVSRINPANGDAARPQARPLFDLQRCQANDPTELIRDRFLSRGGGLLLVGPTGIGKSSLSMQMMISWAAGRPAFNMTPARCLKSLLIQAENDDGDLAEMRDGVVSGLGLTEEQLQQAGANIVVCQEDRRTAGQLMAETVRPLLEEHQSDLLWIDPVLAYLGGDTLSQKDVGAFLRTQLNPLIREFGCAAVIVHHTNKPSAVKDKRRPNPEDFAYSGSGSAEWGNWSRATLTLTGIGNHVFELHASKRGSRLGWKAADGVTTAYRKTIAHNREPGTIFWHEVDPAFLPDNQETTTAPDQSLATLLSLVPADRPILKSTLIKSCAVEKIGKNKARRLIKAQCNATEDRLFEWSKPREGGGPDVPYIARSQQPRDQHGDLIFTAVVTVQTGREECCEDPGPDLHGDLHVRPSLEAVTIAREDRGPEMEKEAAPLLVQDSPAQLDGPPVSLARGVGFDLPRRSSRRRCHADSHRGESINPVTSPAAAAPTTNPATTNHEHTSQ